MGATLGQPGCLCRHVTWTSGQSSSPIFPRHAPAAGKCPSSATQQTRHGCTRRLQARHVCRRRRVRPAPPPWYERGREHHRRLLSMRSWLPSAPQTGLTTEARVLVGHYCRRTPRDSPDRRKVHCNPREVETSGDAGHTTERDAVHRQGPAGKTPFQRTAKFARPSRQDHVPTCG